MSQVIEDPEVSQDREVQDEAAQDSAVATIQYDIASYGADVGRRAFRPIGPLNAAVFDSVMVGLARRLDASPLKGTDTIKQAYGQLLADAEYLALVPNQRLTKIT